MPRLNLWWAMGVWTLRYHQLGFLLCIHQISVMFVHLGVLGSENVVGTRLSFNIFFSLAIIPCPSHLDFVLHI